MTVFEVPSMRMPSLPQLNQFDFHQRLADLPGATLVMFSSPDCGGCRHLRQVLGSVRRARPQWRVFEVDAQRDLALAHEFEIFHLPALFLFNDGEFHCELHTLAQETAIIEATRAALARPAEDPP
jgi:thioredoxin-like negative regulator of GroEL